jgi:hypothetical protein
MANEPILHVKPPNRLKTHSNFGLDFIPPGEPRRNGYVESFNSRVRAHR